MKKSLSGSHYNNLGRVSLLALLSIIHSHTYSNSSTVAVKHFGNFILKVDQLLSQFFDIQNSTPYNDYVISLKKTIVTLSTQLAQGSRSSDDSFADEILEVIDYGTQQFNAAIHVIESHNGKGSGSNQVKAFVTDLNRVFNPDRAFTTLKTKLVALQNKATAAGHTDLVQALEQLIAVIDKKKNSWNNKRLITLHAGLSYRLGR